MLCILIVLSYSVIPNLVSTMPLDINLIIYQSCHQPVSLVDFVIVPLLINTFAHTYYYYLPLLSSIVDVYL